MRDAVADAYAHLREETLRQWRSSGREHPVEGLFITCVTEPTGPIHAVYRPSLCVVVQGAKTSMLGERAFRYDAGKCLIASVDVPIRAQITHATTAEPYLAFSLAFDPAMVADLLLEQAHENESAHDDALLAPPGPALGVHPLPAELIDPLTRMLALAQRPRDLSVLAPMIRREIAWLLLNGPMRSMLLEIGLADSRMARISRAIASIREGFAEPLSVPALAACAGMSAATFHRHFKAVTAMTPVQYQKQLRLQEARRLLLANGGDVAQVGLSIGYESASQFSREYRRLFGAPPGRDGAVMRRSLTAGVEL